MSDTPRTDMQFRGQVIQSVKVGDGEFVPVVNRVFAEELELENAAMKEDITRLYDSLTGETNARMAADDEILTLRAELAGLRMDAERIAFAESKRATIYAAYDNGRVLHWVFVDETKPSDRRGVLGKSIRVAIDAALQPLSPTNEKG